jgi:predicted transcriptional regulator
MADNQYVTFRLDAETRTAMERSAVENDRSLSAEIRRALRQYLDDAKQPVYVSLTP